MISFSESNLFLLRAYIQILKFFRLSLCHGGRKERSTDQDKKEAQDKCEE